MFIRFGYPITRKGHFFRAYEQIYRKVIVTVTFQISEIILVKVIYLLISDFITNFII